MGLWDSLLQAHECQHRRLEVASPADEPDIFVNDLLVFYLTGCFPAACSSLAAGQRTYP